MLTLLKAQKAISHYWSLLIAGLKECHWRLHYLMIQILSGRSIKKVMKEVLLMLRKETYRHLMKFSFLTHNPRLADRSFPLLHHEPLYLLCFTVAIHYCSN